MRLFLFKENWEMEFETLSDMVSFGDTTVLQLGLLWKRILIIIYNLIVNKFLWYFSEFSFTKFEIRKKSSIEFRYRFGLDALHLKGAA